MRKMQNIESITFQGGRGDVAIVTDRESGMVVDHISAVLWEADPQDWEGYWGAARLRRSSLSGLSGEVEIWLKGQFDVTVVRGWVRGPHQKSQAVGGCRVWAVYGSDRRFQGFKAAYGNAVAWVEASDLVRGGEWLRDLIIESSPMEDVTLWRADGTPITVSLPSARHFWRFCEVWDLWLEAEGSLDYSRSIPVGTVSSIHPTPAGYVVSNYGRTLGEASYPNFGDALNSIDGAEVIAPGVGVYERRRLSGDAPRIVAFLWDDDRVTLVESGWVPDVEVSNLNPEWGTVYSLITGEELPSFVDETPAGIEFEFPEGIEE